MSKAQAGSAIPLSSAQRLVLRTLLQLTNEQLTVFDPETIAKNANLPLLSARATLASLEDKGLVVRFTGGFNRSLWKACRDLDQQALGLYGAPLGPRQRLSALALSS